MIGMHVSVLRHTNSLYIDRWLVSEDPTENIRTQQQSVRQDKFLVGGRWIRTRAEYSDMQLYNQLKYYESLFDWKRSERKLTKENEGRRSKVRKVPVFSEFNESNTIVNAGHANADSTTTKKPQRSS